MPESDLCIIARENQSQVYQVKAAVTHVSYTDGTSESILSPEYVTWNLSR